MCALVAGALVPAARAEDKVVLRKPGSIGRVTVTGQIVEFSGKGLDLKPTGGGSFQHYPADEVIDIETDRLPSHERGLKLWQEEDVDGAVEQFELALKQEPRAWGRREILAELIRCAVRRSDYASAGVRFLALYKSDPETRHLRVIPLIWVNESISETALTSARGWLNGANDAARLIGASLLFQDRELGRSAQSTLRDLAKNGPDTLRPLAQWQLRRDEAFSGRVVPGELVYWEHSINSLPADLQGGPSYLLAEAASRRHDHELAAAYWTRLPVLCDYDYRLAARATFEAGRALAKIGQSQEAETMFRETVERFPGTSSAREAEDQLRARRTIEKPPADAPTPRRPSRANDTRRERTPSQ
ncbi:MAG: hypothetical protein NT069_09895 [Planctomycetota bacterium]|nr:hypothetical protein [Planctomycetota bacterium]